VLRAIRDRGKIAAMGDPARKVEPATLAELLALPEDERWELLDGELVRQEMTGFAHGSALLGLGAPIRDQYGRPPGPRGPGGWWFGADVTIELASDQVYRPDLVGWRRDRVPTRPTGFPVRIRPDWVCEILSPSNARNDTVKKLRSYHRHQVPYYWILDPREESLLVLRWAEPGYMTVQTALRGERLCAEPFDAIELDMDDILGDVTEQAPSPGEAERA
jgi:Uma2 family endonuclease